MKINWNKHFNIDDLDLCAYLITKLITNNEDLNKHLSEGKIDSSNLDVVLTINSIEVNFEEAIEQLGQNFDSLVAQKAKDLIQEQIGEIQGNLVSIIWLA